MENFTYLLAKPLVESLKKTLAQDASEFKKKHSRAPKLSVVLVGEDPGSVIYTTKKGEMAHSLGIDHETLKLSAKSSPQEVKDVIQKLNADPNVHGILLQRPLPINFPEEEILYWVDPKKDVDAFHPEQVGRLALGLSCFTSCTPLGIIELLKYYRIPLAGKTACVIGRSAIVGKPIAQLLLKENATVIHCHSQTQNLSALSSQADVLIVAAGKKDLVRAHFVKPGAVVVDVGIHRNIDGKVSGDVCFEEVSKKVSAITPVPGGVGPMTIIMLMKNTLQAAQNQLS